MNIDELNRKYGAPGRIVFKIGHGGYPEVVMANKYGSAEIALLGGAVLSYRPTGNHPVLFRPKNRTYVRGDKFHGGIPICWPQFSKGAIEGLCAHGFAQFMVFEVRGTTYSEESTEITIGLSSDESTRSVWPYDFDLELKVILSMKLNLFLKTENTGKNEFGFTAAFHPYLTVKDVADVTVRGLDGCKYINADNMKEGVFKGDMRPGGGCDHVFYLPEAPKHEFAVLDPGLKRAIAVVGANHTVCTVWNPDKSGKIADHAPEDYKSFVCVEPCTAWRRPLTILKPGESSELSMAIQSVPEI